jgi:hypothetical protein
MAKGKFTNHCVFRAYISLARHEQTVESELGEVKSFYGAKTGKLIGAYPLTQINFYSSEFVEKAIEKFWQKDFEEMFAAGVFDNPGKLANRIISYEVRKRFDVEGVPHFDKDGNLNIPKSCHFIVPKKAGNLITGFSFYRVEKDKIILMEK